MEKLLEMNPEFKPENSAWLYQIFVVRSNIRNEVNMIDSEFKNKWK
jgi:hypothetical protein